MLELGKNKTLDCYIYFKGLLTVCFLSQTVCFFSIKFITSQVCMSLLHYSNLALSLRIVHQIYFPKQKTTANAPNPTTAEHFFMPAIIVHTLQVVLNVSVYMQLYVALSFLWSIINDLVYKLNSLLIQWALILLLTISYNSKM